MARKVLKGFILNGLNPFVVIFWVGIVSVAGTKWEYGRESAFFFFAMLLITVLLADIAKAFMAFRLRTIITSRLMKILNRSVGIIFFILGVRLIYYAIHTVFIIA